MQGDFISKEMVYKKYRIKTMAPIHIGSGEKISTYNYYYDSKTDEFIIPGEELYSVLEKRNKIEKFIESMYNGQKISDFLVRNQDVLEELKKTNVLRIKAAKEKENELEISLLQKSNSAPYIPGSTIKGMIKTAIYYHLYKIGVKLDEIEKLESPKEEKMHKFNNLVVRDFFPIKPIETKVYKLESVEKDKESSKGIPQYVECIPPKSEFLGEIGIEKKFEIEGEKFDHTNMMKWIKEYFEDIMRLERFEFIDQEKKAYVKIGFGKGAFANSILLAIKEKEYGRFKEIIKRTYPKVKRVEEFPKRIWISKETDEPTSWCLLEEIE